MQTLFNGRYSVPAPLVSEPDPEIACDKPPRLLVELTPWRRVFLGNLADRILFLRKEPPLVLTSQPDEFWPDVFVPRRFPVAAFRQSSLYHLFLITVLWGVSHTYLMRPQSLPAQSPFAHQTITYYSVSEYLPPLNDPADSEPALQPKRGEPEYAKQRIVSIPRNPDSHTQTIVTPPKLKLARDLPLPNIVAWTPVPAAVPTAAATHSAQQLVAPAMPAPVAPAPHISAAKMRVDMPEAVEPAPAIDSARRRVANDLAMKAAVVEPSPSVDRMRPKTPNLPLPSAVEPPPTMPDLRRAGDLNITGIAAKVTAPALPVAEQRARGSLLEGTQQHAASAAAPAVAGGAAAAPAAPSLQGLPAGQAGGAQATGQLIALGIHPVPVTGPITVPQGNRTGTFAAGPQGRPGAPATPDIKGGGTTNGAGGSGSNSNGTGPGHGTSGPNGIFVERGASSPAGGVVVADTPKKTAAPASKPSLLASLTRPSVADLARKTAPNAPEPKVEDEVFGAKKYYSMTLNMPNLVSASGSWIIRFAELNVSGEKGELTAPVAMQKVDPAYPSELIRQRVEGTVVLYAVIHADGSVGDVRVLHGVDDRLDQYARVALTKWHFRPGTKNGSAVDLEAVVQIPFTSKRLPF